MAYNQQDEYGEENIQPRGGYYGSEDTRYNSREFGYDLRGSPGESPDKFRGRRLGGPAAESKPSCNLWIGNVSSKVTEQALGEHFGRFGHLTGITIYEGRNYAFVNFKNVEDAIEAHKNLQGISIRGSLPLHIEFSRASRATPSRHLFVGGISNHVSKQQLESEFQRYGRIEDFRLVREKHCAHIDFAVQADAVAAVEGLNGKFLGGEALRVEYGKNPFKLSGFSSANEYHGSPAGRPGGRPPSKFGTEEESPPSRVLWVGHPVYLKVTESMLRREFRVFGELVRVKAYAGRPYSYVEFLRLEDAVQAKADLQGVLFNDPRVQIKFANSQSPIEEGAEGFDRGAARYGRGEEQSAGRSRDRGTWDARLDAQPDDRVRAREGRGEEEWLPQSRQGRRPDAGDSFTPYESAEKRPRMESLPDREPIHVEERPLGRYEEDPRSRKPSGGGGPAFDPRVQKRSEPEAAPPVSLPRGALWMGALAKGGTFVCRAHAFDVGTGRSIDNPMPEVINCTARTDLDVLAKHIYAAPGFGVVALVPVDQPDIPPYEDFVAYLGEKRRAGVAKCLDGSTLFLVPPSDFSQEVLRIPQKDALFGVVLHTQTTQPAARSQPAQPAVAAPASAAPAANSGASAVAPAAASSIPSALTPDVLSTLSSLFPQARAMAPSAPSSSMGHAVSPLPALSAPAAQRPATEPAPAFAAPQGLIPGQNYATLYMQQPSQAQQPQQTQSQPQHQQQQQQQLLQQQPTVQAQSQAQAQQQTFPHSQQQYQFQTQRSFPGVPTQPQHASQQGNSQQQASARLPADQLAQLTALFTQHKPQPAAQQQQLAGHPWTHDIGSNASLPATSTGPAAGMGSWMVSGSGPAQLSSVQVPMNQAQQNPQQQLQAPYGSSASQTHSGNNVFLPHTSAAQHWDTSGNGSVFAHTASTVTGSVAPPRQAEPPQQVNSAGQQAQGQDGGDGASRFQATLQLAAALLQQMQNQPQRQDQK